MAYVHLVKKILKIKIFTDNFVEERSQLNQSCISRLTLSSLKVLRFNPGKYFKQK